MKYSKDGEFNEPVVRCDSCQRIMQVNILKQLGCCACGNRRMRSLTTFTGEELEQMKSWNIDPDFIALFADSGVTI